MTQHDGRVASGRPLPLLEPALLDAHRIRLRSTLPEQLGRMQRTLMLAAGAVDGPDPEAAFGYLDLLDERLQAILAGRQG
jgi:hypothetical protein